MSSVAIASQSRREKLLYEELDKRIDLLLASTGENPNDRFHAVTANPRSMGYLRFLLRHYAKNPHPWAACYRDNFRRFGPKTKGLCGVLKDTIRQNAAWRHGPPRGPHPGHPDVGAPGVAIGEADKWAAPAWGGHKLSEDRPLSLLDELDLEFGIVDHEEPIRAAAEILIALGEKCNVHRVLIGLDEPPNGITLADIAEDKTDETDIDFDQSFIDAMIKHHQVAVKMANEEISKGKWPEVIKLAKNIVSAQTGEIVAMRKMTEPKGVA